MIATYSDIMDCALPLVSSGLMCSVASWNQAVKTFGCSAGNP